MPILTLADRHTTLGGYVAQFWRTDLHGPYPLDLNSRSTADVDPLLARVNHGRWIVDCPTVYCTTAMFVDLSDLRFFCVVCLNPDVNGRWYPVLLPDGRAEVERLLLDRPVPATRNWVPGETPDDLARQNGEHGLTRRRG